MVSAIDATVGTATANSYVTLAQFKTYLGDRANSTDVLLLSDDELSQALFQSAKEMNHIEWQGGKLNTAIDTAGVPLQALVFPRDYTVTYIPPEIQDGQMEQAVFVVRKARQGEESFSGNHIKSFRRGGVSVTFKGETLSNDPEYQFLSERARWYIRRHLARRTPRLMR